MSDRVYKYKLDFYYKSLIIYFLFLVFYVLIRGQFSGQEFYIVFKDPIIYIVLLFILFTFAMLVLYAVRARQIIFENDKFILKNRFGEREIHFSEILSIRFSREKGKKIEGIYKIRIVKLKLKNRKRLLRIRIGEFENERKLIQEFKLLMPAKK